MSNVKYVGNHPGDLASGRMMEPGEVITDMSEEELAHPHNSAMVEDGTLLVLDSTDAAPDSKKKEGKQ